MVCEEAGKPILLYIDLQLVHEVTSPQAFEGLRLNGRKVRRPERTFATVDHAIPTINRNLPFNDPIAAKQVETLRKNCKDFGVRLYDMTLPTRTQPRYSKHGPLVGILQSQRPA